MRKREFGITDSMPFGQYKGELIGTIIEDDPSYIEYLLDKVLIRLDEDALRYLEEGTK